MKYENKFSKLNIKIKYQNKLFNYVPKLNIQIKDKIKYLN